MIFRLDHFRYFNFLKNTTWNFYKQSNRVGSSTYCQSPQVFVSVNNYLRTFHCCHQTPIISHHVLYFINIELKRKLITPQHKVLHDRTMLQILFEEETHNNGVICIFYNLTVLIPTPTIIGVHDKQKRSKTGALRWTSGTILNV